MENIFFEKNGIKVVKIDDNLILLGEVFSKPKLEQYDFFANFMITILQDETLSDKEKETACSNIAFKITSEGVKEELGSDLNVIFDFFDDSDFDDDDSDDDDFDDDDSDDDW